MNDGDNEGFKVPSATTSGLVYTTHFFSYVRTGDGDSW